MATIQNTVEQAPPPGAPHHARSAFSNWLTYLGSGAVSFFLSPFLVRHLGNSAYGVWILLVSLTGYLGFLDLGIRGAVTRYIAKFHSEGDHDRLSRIVSSGLDMFTAGGLKSVGFADGLCRSLVYRIREERMTYKEEFGCPGEYCFFLQRKTTRQLEYCCRVRTK